jgi:hypothetical protein
VPRCSADKAAMVLERERGSRRLTTGDGFGRSLGAGAMAAHREFIIPSALSYTSLRILWIIVTIVLIGIARNRGPLPTEG